MTGCRAVLVLLALAVFAALAGCTPAAAVPSWPTSPAATSAAVSAPTASTTGHCRAVNGRADTACTPGARNPNVTQLNIGSTVCRTGWTKTVRPPASYTTGLKRQQMVAYGVADQPLEAFEEDHLISLELGGDPTSPRNLWPEVWGGTRGAHAKDVEENSLRRAVCAHPPRMTLADAQAQILRDWTHA